LLKIKKIPWTFNYKWRFDFCCKVFVDSNASTVEDRPTGISHLMYIRK